VEEKQTISGVRWRMTMEKITCENKVHRLLRRSRRDSPWICSWRPNSEWAVLFRCNGTVTEANSSRPSRISQFKGMVSPAWQCAGSHRRCCWALSRKKTSNSASPSLLHGRVPLD
jgi:hypothetical protein